MRTLCNCVCGAGSEVQLQTRAVLLAAASPAGGFHDLERALQACCLSRLCSVPAGISVKAFEENAGLQEHYNVLSLSLDRRGDVYVSTFESKRVRSLAMCCTYRPQDQGMVMRCLTKTRTATKHYNTNMHCPKWGPPAALLLRACCLLMLSAGHACSSCCAVSADALSVP